VAQPDVSPEVRIFLPYPAVHAVSRDDQVGLRQLRCSPHLVVILDAHAETLRPGRQQVHQIRPVEIVDIHPAVVHHSFAADMDELFTPAEGGQLNLSRRLGVIAVELLPQIWRECHPPAET